MNYLLEYGDITDDDDIPVNLMKEDPNSGQGSASNESSEFEAIRRYYQRMGPHRAAPTNERTSVRSISYRMKPYSRSFGFVQFV